MGKILILPDDVKADVALGYIHADQIAPVFMESVINLICHPGTKYTISTIVTAHGSRLTENRNNVVRRFLETSCDWLFFVDTDIQFQPTILDQLLSAAAPDTLILAAPYWTVPKDGQELMTWHDHELKPLMAIQSAGMLELGACGMGCTLIHRRVFQAMQAKWKDPKDPWIWFAHDLLPFGERAGEDVTFPVDPATPVLGVGWRWRPISEFRVGDGLLALDEYGTRYSSRRYCQATVEGVVEKTLPRVRLITDEEEVITTGEHPWLSRKGDHDAWTWTAAGALEVGAPLALVVPPAANPDLTSQDYAAGYVQGLLHSDGTRTGSQFVIRMKDSEPLERAATMFAHLGIASRRGPAWWDGNPRHAPMERLSVNERASWLATDDIFAFAGLPSDNFACGYLAGMFDGDGSHHGGKLQIHSVREVYKDRLEAAARMIGAPFTGRNLRSVTMHGQDNLLRFWQRICPALLRRTFPLGQMANDGVSCTGQEVKYRPQTIRGLERLPADDVLCLQTTSSTFVASGLASHNCLRAKAHGFSTWGVADPIVEHYKLARQPRRILTADEL